MTVYGELFVSQLTKKEGALSDIFAQRGPRFLSMKLPNTQLWVDIWLNHFEEPVSA